MKGMPDIMKFSFRHPYTKEFIHEKDSTRNKS